MTTATIRIGTAPIDPAAALQAVPAATSGGIALFLGTVRDHNEGKSVRYLEYEGYAAMAERQMQHIAAALHREWELQGLWLEHRLGRLEIGEISVLVCVAAGHRDAAFAACRLGIDLIKRDVPIWKKEHYADGSVWLGQPR